MSNPYTIKDPTGKSIYSYQTFSKALVAAFRYSAESKYYVAIYEQHKELTSVYLCSVLAAEAHLY